MATRKVRTGRKTKSMRVRTKSRRYKVRGGDNKEEMQKLAREIALLLGNLTDHYNGTKPLSDEEIEEKQEDINVKQSMLKAMDVMDSPPTKSAKALSLLG